jgi:hypothetical protein
MEPAWFAALRRASAVVTSRRAFGRLLAALGLGGPVASTFGQTQAKTCGPCQKKKGRKCRGSKPDGEPCGSDGGVCVGGACRGQPSSCSVASDAYYCQDGDLDCCARCCTGMCESSLFSKCAKGSEGDPCKVKDDCVSLNCVFYECQP